MRAKLLANELAVPATATTAYSTPVLLTAANVGSVYGGDEAVPGEDLAFSSSGSGVVAVHLEGATFAAGDTVFVQVSNNYYADGGSGETWTTVATATPGALTTKSKPLYLDRVPFGEAMRLGITTTGATGVGSVSADILTD
ncbi:MAG: hypothetical protein KGL39_14735 [Patescibacteria group bacterium]|nr:hypothetical protein [Patescibacteria group bacterium]